VCERERDRKRAREKERGRGWGREREIERERETARWVRYVGRHIMLDTPSAVMIFAIGSWSLPSAAILRSHTLIFLFILFIFLL
jgi:hypothetical protein